MIENIDSLTPEESLEILKHDIRFHTDPVDIETFVNDDYFLGSWLFDKNKGRTRIYDIWMDRLWQVFPNNITTHSYIVTTGAIGCLTGDTLIVSSTGFISLFELLDKWESRRINSSTNPVYVQSFNTRMKKVELDKITNVFYSGYADTYKITLSNDLSYTCTSNHPILLANLNWSSLKEGLKVGEEIYWEEEKRWIKKIEYAGKNHVYDISTEKNHNFFLSSGCILHNTGKSTFSEIILTYDYYKAMCTYDLPSFCNIISQQGIDLTIFNIFKYKALEMIAPINNWIKNAPVFMDMKKREIGNYNNYHIKYGAKMNDIISRDVMSIQFSELNFLPSRNNAKKLLYQALSRQESRFASAIDIFTHVLLDSSDTTVDSIVNEFAFNSAYSSRCLVFTCSIWEAKPFNYWKTGGFKIYTGDSLINPHIISSDEDTESLDKDRIKLVPNELKPNFESDIDLAMQEKMGISTYTRSLLFPDDRINRRFTIPSLVKPTIVLDFFDDQQIVDIDGITDAIELLPDDRYIYCGIDNGLVNDKFGFSLGYAESISIKRIEDEKVEDIYIKVPFAVSFSRKLGQETNISKIRDFILYINSIRPIKKVVGDSYQSSQLFQELKMNNIATKVLSVEQDKFYMVLKRLLYQDRIDLVKNDLLLKEFKCLRRIGNNRIDHSGLADADGKVGINSKDIADSVTRLVAQIYMDGKEALNVPLENGNYYADVWNDMLKSTNRQRVQREYESRFAAQTHSTFK